MNLLASLKSAEVILGGRALDAGAYSLAIDDTGVRLTAEAAEFIRLTFDVALDDACIILGDAFERTYGDVCFRPKRDVLGKLLPWYFLAKNGGTFSCFGVTVRPDALAYWQVGENELTLTYNVCSGPDPVALGGRTLELGRLIASEGEGSFVTVGRAFCRRMCTDGILPRHTVYGANNWYYAYGKSSHAEILEDAAYLAELTRGIENRPYLVIDDCWEKNRCAGPWNELNERFTDMRALCAQIRAMGLHAGIWVRPLYYKGVEFPEEWILAREGDGVILDITVPAAREYVLSVFRSLKDWGYELIKYDFVFRDLTGDYAPRFNAASGCGKFRFADKTKTTAEIMTEFARDVKNAVGADVLLIGCNTSSHLSAGYVEIARTGDDTSGREWGPTKKMGINTLAYRIIQNGIFYVCDADCVGLTEAVEWEKNKSWLTLLAHSGTPLFLSSRRGVATEAQKAFVRECFIENNKPHTLEPLFTENDLTPAAYLIDGEKTVFDI